MLSKFSSHYLPIVDTSSIENPLAYQLKDDNRLSKIVDVFYYEHHVMQQELLPWWGGTASGSVSESLQLMAGIRAKGVASHYWP